MEQSQIQGNNQQERWLYWLGGIIDGEGTITINWNYRSNKKVHFTPKILIANTNKDIIDKCQKLLEEQKLAYWIQSRPSLKLEKLPTWRIEIRGYKRVARALSVLSKYLVGKKKQASLVKEFVDRRIQDYRKEFNQGDGQCKAKCPNYSERELELIIQLTKLNNQNPQRLYAELRKYKLRNKI